MNKRGNKCKSISEELQKDFALFRLFLYSPILDIFQDPYLEYRGVAKCCEQDEFSEKVGRQIADIKIGIKYHTSMAKKYKQLERYVTEAKEKFKRLRREHEAYIEMYDEKLKSFM